MESAYVQIQMDMHRMQELDSLLEILREQKNNNSTAIRRLRQQKGNGAYFCGGSFFQKMNKESALGEIETLNRQIDENITNNRNEHDILTKKMHQMGIYSM